MLSESRFKRETVTALLDFMNWKILAPEIFYQKVFYGIPIFIYQI